MVIESHSEFFRCVPILAQTGFFLAFELPITAKGAHDDSEGAPVFVGEEITAIGFFDLNGFQSLLDFTCAVVIHINKLSSGLC